MTDPTTTTTSSKNNSLTPIHSLLRSATRFPSSKKGYLILLQHAQTLSNRILSTTSSFSSSKKEKEEEEEHLIHSMAGVRLPYQTAQRNLSGFALQKAVQEEIVKRMNGFVVKVCLLSPNEEEEEEENGGLFGRNGVMVDLYSDPLGWDTNDDDEEEEEEKRKQKVFKCSNIRNLQHIAQIIQDASSSLLQNNNNNNNNNNKVIPILFDSIQPLLSLHGVYNTSLFLHQLLQNNSSSTTTTTTTIKSPIVVSIQSTCIQPKSMRYIEDLCNAVLTLESHGELRIVRRSNNAGASGDSSSLSSSSSLFVGGRLVNEMQPFTICKTMHGYKFVFTSNNDKEEEDDDDDDDENNEDENLIQNSTTTKKKKSKIILKHEEEEKEEEEKENTSIMTKGPRIYMQDDDPEFDDLDEEDPDDDLDI